jgi:hypothetical protein
MARHQWDDPDQPNILIGAHSSDLEEVVETYLARLSAAVLAISKVRS